MATVSLGSARGDRRAAAAVRAVRGFGPDDDQSVAFWPVRNGHDDAADFRRYAVRFGLSDRLDAARDDSARDRLARLFADGLDNLDCAVTGAHADHPDDGCPCGLPMEPSPSGSGRPGVRRTRARRRFFPSWSGLR